MTTALHTPITPHAIELVSDLVPVRAGGILARVKRPCDEHACDCACVGHLEDEGCLVFWCDRGAHHITVRS
jgi:hypothetical protein